MKNMSLLFLLLFIGYALAQNEGKTAKQNKSINIESGWGIGLGWNQLTSIGSDAVTNDEGAIDFSVFFKLKVDKNFFLQSEVIYSPHSFRYNANTLSEFKSAALNLNYLKIPILFEYKFFDFTKGLGYGIIYAGPGISIILNDEINPDSDIERELNQFVFSSFLGLVIGVGILSVDIRYELGLTSLYEKFVYLSNDGSKPIGDLNFKYNIFSISIRYSF